MTHLSYYEFLIMLFGAMMLSSLYGFDKLRIPLAFSKRESRSS